LLSIHVLSHVQKPFHLKTPKGEPYKLIVWEREAPRTLDISEIFCLLNFTGANYSKLFATEPLSTTLFGWHPVIPATKLRGPALILPGQQLSPLPWQLIIYRPTGH